MMAPEADDTYSWLRQLNAFRTCYANSHTPPASKFAGFVARCAAGMRRDEDVHMLIVVHPCRAKQAGCPVHMSWGGAIQSRVDVPIACCLGIWAVVDKGQATQRYVCWWHAPPEDPLAEI